MTQTDIQAQTAKKNVHPKKSIQPNRPPLSPGAIGGFYVPGADGTLILCAEAGEGFRRVYHPELMPTVTPLNNCASRAEGVPSL